MRKTNLIVLLALVVVLCLSFAACTVEKANNSISGLADITATCGDTVPKLNATAEYGEVAYGLAKAVEGTAKESLTYGEYSGTLTHGIYYVKATVAEGDGYKSAEAYAKITVNHQAFDKIAGNGETKHETTAEGKYRVWTEKKCACGVTIVGNETITDKLPATISGIADIDNAKCGYIVSTAGITSDKGTLTFAIATEVEGTAKENLTYTELGTTPLNAGVYYLKASVAESEDYKAAEAYAKITVNHQAFDEIAGNGETKHETTAEGKYRVWTEKKCACGVTIVGNETITDKLPASISGIADIDNAKCGYVVSTDGITSDKGTLTFAIATEVEGTAKENLTYVELDTTPLNAGVYYLKASVAEGEDYKAAEAYAKITVTHKSYDEIDGEGTFVAPVFDTQTKGYYKKQCVCGQDIKGSDEYVTVRVTIDGVALDDKVVKVGDKLGNPSDLPQARKGYDIVISDAEGQQFDFAAHTVNDFEIIALTSKEYAVEVRNGKYSNKNGGEWMFIEGAASYITDETISIFTQKDGYVEIQTNFLPDNVTASMQLSLGSAVVDAYHTYKFTFKATQGTFVWFGNNFENAKFTYTDAMAAENTVVEVVLTCVDGNLVGNFNGQQLNFGKIANLNATVLHFQDKDEELFANRGKRYTITVTDMVATYDYMSEAQAVLATIPADVADVTVDNAFSLEETIEAFDNIANKYFSAKELANIVVAADVRARVTEIVGDPLIYLNNIIKDLPAFDNGKALTSANEAQLYQIIVDYVDYAKTMLTAEQLETYTEPREVSLYRHYFFKNSDSAVVDVLNKVGVTGGDISGNKIVFSNGGTMTLPAINFDLYQDITLGIKIHPSAGEAVSSVAYNGKIASVTTKSGADWAQFHARKVDGVWYAQMSGPQSFDKNKAVELPADVVNGKEGVRINFACDEGAAINVLFDVAYNATSDGTQKAVANTLVGKLVQPDVNVYTVVYNYKTESGADDSTIYYYIEGEQLALPQIPAEYIDHHTYELEGWFAGKTEYKGGETVSSDLEIAATYSVNTYETHTINFYLSDADSEAYATKTINYGDKLVLPEDPTKDPVGGKKYKFAYWITTDGTIVTVETIVEDDMELTAVFVEFKQVTVTYTNLDGDDIVDNTYYAGDKVERPVDPVRDGFAFMGWYTLDGEEYLFDSYLDENELTLVAKWYMESKVKSVLYTAEQMKTIVKSNWGTLTAASVGMSFLFDTDGQTTNDNFANLLKVGNEGLSQTWSLPAMNYKLLYEKVEFVMSKGGLSVAIAGQDVDLSSGTEKNHFLFQIKDGMLNVYGINSYGKAIVSYNLPQAVINGTEPLTIEMKMGTSGEMRISEVHATAKYIDHVSEAAKLDSELAEWCKTNAVNVAAMTAEQKAIFATKLNELYIARGAMTTYEASVNKISDIITSTHSELAKLDDAFFDMFSAVSDLKYDALFRNASDDKSGQAVKNSAYKAFNQATALDYFAFVTDGKNTSAVSLTLPAINFEALNMTFSFNFARQGTTNETLVTLNGQENANKYNAVGNNLEWCYVMSIYKDATKGWIARWHTDRGDYDYTVQLTEAQANGSEALTFNVTLSGPAWFTLFITNISATF